MTRGPKPKKLPEIIDAAAVSAEFGHGLAVMRQEAHVVRVLAEEAEQRVRELAIQIGYQLPADCVDPEMIQRDIVANMRRSVEACLEVGRGLAVLKEACGHGQFLQRLDAMEVNDRVARRFMQAALKFSNRAFPHVLDAVGSQTKLFELIVLDDEELEELEETGQLGRLLLDDIERMSSKELKAALRDARAENRAKEELLAERNKQRDALQEKLVRKTIATPDEKLAALRHDAETISMLVRGQIEGPLLRAVSELNAARKQHGVDCRVFLAGLFAEILIAIEGVREEFGIPDARSLSEQEIAWVYETENSEDDGGGHTGGTVN